MMINQTNYKNKPKKSLSYWLSLALVKASSFEFKGSVFLMIGLLFGKRPIKLESGPHFLILWVLSFEFWGQ